MPRPTKLAVAVALNLLSRAAQATEVQRAPAGVQPRDASKSRVWGYHGVVFGGGEWGAEGVALGSGGANASLQAAVAEAGVSTIRLIPTWFVDNINTTAIYRNEPGTPFSTVDDQGVVATMQLARSLGVKVIVGPLLDPNWIFAWNRRGSGADAYPGAECLLWRSKKAGITQRPKNCTKAGVDLQSTGRDRIGYFLSELEWDAWFVSYEAFLMVYAQLAETHGAEVFIVATEISAAMNRQANIPRWVALCRRLRAVFSGRLAVAQNAKALIPWHAEVDLLGFAMYNGLTEGHPVATATPPTVFEMAQWWSPYIDYLENVTKSTGKPIFACELGFQSRPRSFMSPAGSTRFSAGDCSVYEKCYSMADQRLAYAGFYLAFSGRSWFQGVLWWMWRADPTNGGLNDMSFTPSGKPAALEMKAHADRQGTLLRLDHAVTATARRSQQTLEKRKQPWTRLQRQRDASIQPPLVAPSPYSHKQNGIVVGSAEWTSWEDPANSSRLDSAAAAASLASARAHGVNAAEFIPTWFFPDDSQGITSGFFYRGEATGNPRALQTDTDDEIRAGVQVAKSLGMRTCLSPMFDPDYSQFPIWNASSGGPTSDDKKSLAGGGAGRGDWGKSWTPSQIGSWFDEYNVVIVRYAELAEALQVDEYHVGHELHTLLTNPANEQHWRGLIAKVRMVYRGKVSVAFNGNPFFNDLAANGVPWLDVLDHIGLDCYWPIYTNLTKLQHWWSVPTGDEVAAAWGPTVQKLQEVVTTHNLTITCTEVGYQSRNYAWIRGLNNVELDPADCSVAAECVNQDAQAAAYEGLLKALYPHDWFNGVYLWLWRTDPDAGGSSDASYTPQNKKAAKVMSQWFGGSAHL